MPFSSMTTKFCVRAWKRLNVRLPFHMENQKRQETVKMHTQDEALSQGRKECSNQYIKESSAS